jgi:flagellar protein FlbD
MGVTRFGAVVRARYAMRGHAMIRLTRLNNSPIVVNSDLIKLVENAPDTVLTLVTGEKMVVLESIDEVIQKIIEFRRKILAELPLQVVRSISPAVDLTSPIELVAKES